jgi:hypothetical protein
MTGVGKEPKPPRNGRSCKRKGYGFEREFVNFMREGHLTCNRVPLSGSGLEKGDCTIHSPCLERKLRGELKRRKALPAWIIHALGEHDFMAMREDRGETLVVIRASLFRDLIQ